MLFEPGSEFAERNGANVAEAAVEVSEEQEVTLILQNHIIEAVELAEGHILGMAQSVEEVTAQETGEPTTNVLDDGESITVNAFLPPQVPRVQ